MTVRGRLERLEASTHTLQPQWRSARPCVELTLEDTVQALCILEEACGFEMLCEMMAARGMSAEDIAALIALREEEHSPCEAS